MIKIEKLVNKLPETDAGKQVDACIITSSTNRFYFTGFKSSMGFIFATRDKAYFLVDFRYYEAAVKTIKDMDVIEIKNLEFDLRNIAKRHNIKGILIENENISLALADKLQFMFSSTGASIIKTKTLDRIISDMRAIKDSSEIVKIKKAQEISEFAFNHILKKIRPGVTEVELAFDLELLMRKNGAEAIAFDLIVLSGENGSVPHGVPSCNTVKNGDFITIDMGAVFEGYHSDMTRTVAMGKVSTAQEKVYNTVLKAQMEALKSIKAGVVCSAVDKIARDIIDNAGYKGRFGHSLGHGVGLNIHEEPRLSSANDAILQENMIVTVEPGIYINSSFGVRIEDMVVVTKDGYENLTNVDKNLICL